MSAPLTFKVERSAFSEIRIGPGVAMEPPPSSRFRHAVFIVDNVVAARQRRRVETITSRWARQSTVLYLDAGEKIKTPQAALHLFRKLEMVNLVRGDALIAVGGGTITDLVAFVAQLFMRGLPLVLMPTTLLAQVDAAIGGKNGLNLGEKKNRIGSFYYPCYVLCDTNFLGTLPKRQMLSGLAEIIKVQSIIDCMHIGRLATWDARRPGLHVEGLPDLVARSVKAKIRLLARDPCENSQERLLNFGHSLAHAIEEMSGFRLTHGEAVLLSMLCEAKIGCLAGKCSDGTFRGFREVVVRTMSPTSRRFVADAERLKHAFLETRRLRGGHDHLVVLGDSGLAGFISDVDESLVVTAWNEVMENKGRDLPYEK